MKAFLEKLMGPSWRTSSAGLIETIVVLGGAWLALPEDIRTNPKVYVPALLAALVKFLKDSQTKDKAVSGNASEGFTVAQKDGETKVIPPNP